MNTNTIIPDVLFACAQVKNFISYHLTMVLISSSITLFTMSCYSNSNNSDETSINSSHDAIPTSVNSREPDIFVLGSEALIPENELDGVIGEANKGDGKAAYRLYAHYGIAMGEIDKALEYLDLAVRLKYPPAMYDKAMRMYQVEHAAPEDIYVVLLSAIEAGAEDTANLLPKVQEELQKRGTK